IAPDCWTISQCLQKQAEYPWLIIKNKQLGCSFCGKVKNLGMQKSQGSRISTEWANCIISPFGDTRKIQQMSLRKKMHDHKTSKSHVAAEKIMAESGKQVKENKMANSVSSQLETTSRIFRTAYKIGKRQRPFTDLPIDVDVQELNGLNMGRVLQSDKVCADIIDHISAEMRRKVLSNIQEKRTKISVMVDESTALSKRPVLIVCLRAIVGDSPDPLSFFLELLELNDSTAAGIVTALLDCLKHNRFTEAFLQSNWISFVSDGASTMLGEKSGVAHLLEHYPKLFIWHCCSHRLELAVGDTAREVSGVNHLQVFFDKLYVLYHSSAKNQQELRKCAESVAVQLLTIGKILDIRWVASSESSIKAVWNAYTALYNHFSEASTDSTRDSRQRAKYSGLRHILTSAEFVHNLGVMYDAVSELSDLSKQLQRKDITLPEAHMSMSRQIRVFASMADTAGPFAVETEWAIQNMSFRDTKLHRGRCIKIDAGRFFRSLANNMESRLMTTRASNTSASNYDDSMKYLDPKTWPSSNMDIQYGDNKIRSLCRKFNISEVDSIRGFRIYKDCGSNEVPSDLKPLLAAVKTIPVSTAECERGFSIMNTIMHAGCCSLSIQDHV
uniref:Uncharacterized protein n=1 Tax=Latimeria chalumnae TaxID=7897 RepID=H3A963_LATCH